MKIKLTVVFLFFYTICFNQVNIDSLFNIWLNKSLPDSARVSAYADYIRYGFLFTNPDSAFGIAEELNQYGIDKSFPMARAKAINLQGISWGIRGESEKALDCFNQSLRIHKEIGDKEGIAECYGNIGIIYTNQSGLTNQYYDPQKGLSYYQKSLAVLEEIDDKEGAASILVGIGLIYTNLDNYPKALYCYQRSLKTYEETENKRGIARALNNIGIIYQMQKDLPNALQYFRRTIEISKDLGISRMEAGANINMGGIYLDQELYDTAKIYFERGLAICEANNHLQFMVAALTGLGNVNTVQGNYNKAREYLEKSLSICRNINHQLGEVATITSIGILYNYQSTHIKAIETCLEGLDMALELQSIINQKEACECLYEAYKATGNSKNALEFHEQLLVLEDSLKKDETAKILQQMEFSKQVLADSIANAEKQRQIQEAYKKEVLKEKQTRNISIVIGVIMLIFAGGFYSRWRYIRKSRDIISKEKERSENLLLNILPADVARELKEKGKADARDFDMVSILFTDFVDFTSTASNLSASQLVTEVNYCFEAFDHIMEKYGIEKIKTIGDAYMAAGGLPVSNPDSVKNSVLATLEMQEFIKSRKAEKDTLNESSFEMRVGIHTGPVVAGIVGVKKFQYDVWGDTVNTASRVENHCKPGTVNISQITYDFIKDDPEFTFESRGKIEVKGKGEMDMWFVKKV